MSTALDLLGGTILASALLTPFTVLAAAELGRRISQDDEQLDGTSTSFDGLSPRAAV